MDRVDLGRWVYFQMAGRWRKVSHWEVEDAWRIDLRPQQQREVK